jgi:hypothetical protein
MTHGETRQNSDLPDPRRERMALPRASAVP